MSEQRIILDRCYAYRYIEVDQNGTESYKTDSTIVCSTVYANAPVLNFQPYGSVDFSGNQYLPTAYKAIKLNKTCFGKEYEDTYRMSYTDHSIIYLYCTEINPNVYPGVRAEFPYFPSRINYSTAYIGSYQAAYKSIGRLDNSNEESKSGVSLLVGLYPPTGGTYNLNTTVYGYAMGIGSINPPYVKDVVFTRCDPEINNITPASGSFVDDMHDMTIKWNLNIATSNSGIVYNPTEITFLWGTDQNVSNSISLPVDATSVTIPANTFPDKATVYWKIRWKSDAADEYLYTDLATYSTTDSVPNVSIVSPVNASIDGETDNIFTWQYVNDTGTPQSAFDLQISNDNGKTWAALFSHTESPETQAVIPAGTFLAGNGLWRVRGYNTDDAASEWTEPVAIIVRAAPKPPVISGATQTPRITVSWQSSGQQAYRVTANGYDSGVVFGTGKTFVIPYYFAAGETVEVSVQIKNRFGQWSDKTTIVVQVSNVSPGTITMTASAENAGIVLSWQSEGTFAKYYILRDGEPIARTEETGYTDYFSAGESRYQVMGVDADGYYALSEEITLAPELENGVISRVEPVDWIPLAVKRGNQPEFVSSHAESITYQYYSGRMLPVPYSSRFREVTRTLDFTVKLPAYRRLKALVGEIVIYKDYTGEKMIGVLNDLQTSGRPDRPDISASITAIDYSEVIPFD